MTAGKRSLLWDLSVADNRHASENRNTPKKECAYCIKPLGLCATRSKWHSRKHNQRAMTLRTEYAATQTPTSTSFWFPERIALSRLSPIQVAAVKPTPPPSPRLHTLKGLPTHKVFSLYPKALTRWVANGTFSLLFLLRPRAGRPHTIRAAIREATRPLCAL